MLRPFFVKRAAIEPLRFRCNAPFGWPESRDATKPQCDAPFGWPESCDVIAAICIMTFGKPENCDAISSHQVEPNPRWRRYARLEPPSRSNTAPRPRMRNPAQRLTTRVHILHRCVRCQPDNSPLCQGIARTRTLLTASRCRALLRPEAILSS